MRVSFNLNWPFILFWTLYVLVILVVALFASCTLLPEAKAGISQGVGAAVGALTGSDSAARFASDTIYYALGGATVASAGYGVRHYVRKRRRQRKEAESSRPKKRPHP